MLSFRKALKAELEFLSSISISTVSPSKSISVSSFDKEPSMLVEISVMHLAIALLSGRWASQDIKLIFMIVFYLGNVQKLAFGKSGVFFLWCQVFSGKSSEQMLAVFLLYRSKAIICVKKANHLSSPSLIVFANSKTGVSFLVVSFDRTLEVIELLR